ncbi:TPA: benzoate/H(+) symporter BenE family transporter [Aeromonas salmonicida subsp. salmonicida]|uniref:benzoate/H(+) symporter BenE family transporter n=1 Tax=Aeromonas salmonicida TaxID=645 RepID=UPI0013203A86|nr:benzoate/H(+) symporter BenE family transporter [Aeromonas salmonicida]ELI6420024.1 benzoate/H(+) symporter BenE family transporter [Aeromonas salmonicida subsp. salmonicida]ELM3648403.1 benzoate/H(+) symporter BenE family transporter [Aeromonas salmonicida subsp. salmonicida]QHE44450.1 benzoate/H(+) symporter BenE family transporter [Aeromonas salmonicida subsp. salmonicida]QHE46241.1 benzoate/H(+) symporter BenE family transporter [Aeromonas salmonicida subsp. salmonicida]
MPFALPHLVAGFIAVMVGYISSVILIIQAATAAGADAAQLASWLWTLGIGMGISCIGLSFYYRIPVLTAWSTPGAALLITSLGNFTLAEAIGAFVISSLLITLCGISGWFDRLMRHIPAPLAAAMLAGVLLRFGLDLFRVAPQDPLLLGPLLLAFLLGRHLWPRYTMVLAMGITLCALRGDLQLDTLHWQLASPVWTWPSFSFDALFGIALPLFIVTMTSQNMPGITILRAHGYQPATSSLIGWTGLIGLLLAPFGGYAFNLAAITAAICMGKDVDPDASRRWPAAVWAGGFYLLTGCFGASVAALFTAFPATLVTCVAGLALLGTIGSSLHTALQQDEAREAALLTFIITASGISLLGVGAACWGLLVGVILHQVNQRRN